MSSQTPPPPPARPSPPRTGSGVISAPVEVAESAIDALKASPTALALILLNVVFIGSSTYALVKLNQYHHEEITSLIDRCTIPTNSRSFNPEGR